MMKTLAHVVQFQTDVCLRFGTPLSGHASTVSACAACVRSYSANRQSASLGSPDSSADECDRPCFCMVSCLCRLCCCIGGCLCRLCYCMGGCLRSSVCLPLFLSLSLPSSPLSSSLLSPVSLSFLLSLPPSPPSLSHLSVSLSLSLCLCR